MPWSYTHTSDQQEKEQTSLAGQCKLKKVPPQFDLHISYIPHKCYINLWM